MTPEAGTPEVDDQARLRAVLGFPASVETIDGVAGRAVSSASADAPAEDARDPVERQLDDMRLKVDRLSVHTDALRALLDEVLDRLDVDPHLGGVTTEEVADIAARMVRVIETRLEAHTARIEAELAELREAVEANRGPNLQRVQ